MHKLFATTLSVLIALGATALLQPRLATGQPLPKAKAKGKEDPKKKGGPQGDLRKAYDLLRRLRADEGSAGRSEERLRDWTDRAAKLYRQGLKALGTDDARVAREYGTAAHDLARAVDHARNASRFDRPDPDLPPPSDDAGPDDEKERARRDLRHAYDRIQESDAWREAPEFEFYNKAARDLYSAARRDLEAGRDERGAELARAAEAMTHVPEHLARAGEARDGGDFRPAPPDEPRKPAPPAKKAEPRGSRGSDLPPPLS